MKVVLAEKPSVARDIAKELHATSRKDGYLEGNGYIVTWAFGHLIGLKEPDEYDPAYKRWSLDVLPIIPQRFELKPTDDKGARKQLNIIKKLFKQADEIICATDAGREGELIFRYIQIWSQSTRVPFKRLWISSLTSQAIRNGFAHLADGHAYDHLFHAARCRSEADWIVGMNGSRYFTLQFSGNNTLWSIGRVQTPVLALIVNRDHEIENFKPEDYWEVHTRYRETLFKHQNGKFTARDMANAVLQKITGHDLVIGDVQGREEKIPPPLLHDLTDLQKEMSRRHGMTATRALNAAQNLYERKHLTYPRTDSRYLSSDMKPGIPGLLEKLKAVRATEIARLDLRNLAFTGRLVNDAKVTDHHAIIPTEIVPQSDSLGGDEARVYEAVITRFIAVFYPYCRKHVTTVLANSNGEPFKATGRTLTDEGWQALYPHMNRKQTQPKGQKPETGTSRSAGPVAEDLQQMPAFTKGEKGPHEPELKTLQTKPPSRFNEATLLQAMETAGRMVEEEELKAALAEKGLGTPATRAQIIETLLHRKYISRAQKNLISTSNGRHLIAVVHDERLKSPELTGEWEANLKRMERGAYDPGQFMEDVITHVRGIIAGPGTGDNAATATNAGPGPCPLCGAPVIKGREHYGCSRWKEGCPFVLKCSGFSVDINAGLAAELLRNHASLTPHLLTVDGKPVFGTLHLQKDGTVSCERIDSGSPAPETGGSGDALGICPACGGSISETKKGYGCSNWRNGCRFVIWKTIAGKKISKTNVKKLLATGETAVLDGFKAKTGKPFSAKLKLEGNGVKFDFDPPGPANHSAKKEGVI